jgi:aminopeptidase C
MFYFYYDFSKGKWFLLSVLHSSNTIHENVQCDAVVKYPVQNGTDYDVVIDDLNLFVLGPCEVKTVDTLYYLPGNELGEEVGLLSLERKVSHLVHH